MTQPIDLRDADGVAVLRLTRPPVNALDLETLEALPAAFHGLAADPPKHGLVFASSNGHFSAELDLKAFRSGARKNSPQMTGITIEMTDQEITAVSDYIAGLR